MIRCVCGHALSSHRQDPNDPWVAERCRTCGCAGFENREEDKMQGDEDDAALLSPSTGEPPWPDHADMSVDER